MKDAGNLYVLNAIIGALAIDYTWAFPWDKCHAAWY
jgi:hypothetical protein